MDRCAHYDTDYERHGVSNRFLCFEPLRGWRHVEVSERRTAVDWAQQVQQLVDVHYPEAERITLVMDHLNTPIPASRYKAFAPAEARRILQRLNIHYTPQHSSWLNMAKIEFSTVRRAVLSSRQCLDRRIPDQATLREEIAAWEATRNAEATAMHWRFTTADARIKLRRLYPTTED